MNYKYALSFFLALMPFLVVYGANMIWPSNDNDGKCVPFRPPGSSYGLAWGFLLLLFSWSWVNVLWNNSSTEIGIASTMLVLLLIALVMWQKNYHQNRLNGVSGLVWVMFLLLPSIVYVYSTGNHWSAVLLLPLLVWVVFQTYVNSTEISCRQRA